MGITIFFSMFFLIFVFIIIFQSFSTAKKNGKNKENNDEKIMTIKSIFAKKETIQKENYNKKDEDIYASDNYSSSFDGIKGFDAKDYKKTVERLNTQCPSCHSSLEKGKKIYCLSKMWCIFNKYLSKMRTNKS